MIDSWSTSPADAAAHFTARLALETDVSDVHAALESGAPGFVLMDSTARAVELDPAVPVVTYCWGPGCNGATRAALSLARLGYRVREMLGGFEYWAREGLPAETADGVHLSLGRRGPREGAGEPGGRPQL